MQVTDSDTLTAQSSGWNHQYTSKHIMWSCDALQCCTDQSNEARGVMRGGLRKIAPALLRGKVKLMNISFWKQKTSAHYTSTPLKTPLFRRCNVAMTTTEVPQRHTHTHTLRNRQAADLSRTKAYTEDVFTVSVRVGKENVVSQI